MPVRTTYVQALSWNVLFQLMSSKERNRNSLKLTNNEGSRYR